MPRELGIVVDMKRALKRAATRAGLNILSRRGLARAMPAAAGRGLIFTLHHVRPAGPHEAGPNAHLSVRPAFLRTALETALAAGLVPARLADLPSLLADPDDRRRYVCVTLDDGYRDNAAFAAPIFRDLAIPYTIFVTPGFVERSHGAWWETIEAVLARHASIRFDFGHGPETLAGGTPARAGSVLARFGAYIATMDEGHAVAAIDRMALRCGIDAAGIVDDLVMTDTELAALATDPLADFGAHTISHVNLARVNPQRLEAEIRGSIDRVAAYVARRPTGFAYPYGGRHAVSEREVIATAQAGMRVAVTTQPGMLGPISLSRPTDLRRVSLSGHLQMARHVRAVLSGLPFLLAASRSPPASGGPRATSPTSFL